MLSWNIVTLNSVNKAEISCIPKFGSSFLNKRKSKYNRVANGEVNISHETTTMVV